MADEPISYLTPDSPKKYPWLGIILGIVGLVIAGSIGYLAYANNVTKNRANIESQAPKDNSPIVTTENNGRTSATNSGNGAVGQTGGQTGSTATDEDITAVSDDANAINSDDFSADSLGDSEVGL